MKKKKKQELRALQREKMEKLLKEARDLKFEL